VLPPVSGSGRADAEGLAEALADALAEVLADALADALAEAAPPPALSCTRRTCRLSAKTVPTAKALYTAPSARDTSGTVRTVSFVPAGLTSRV
jgi:hypothetical protein